jgi:sortase B
MEEREQENQTPRSIRIYRKLRYVLAALVLLILAASVAQVIHVFREYWRSEDAYRSVSEAYVLPPRTPRSDPQQNAAPAPDGNGQTGEATPGPDGKMPDEPGTTPAPGEPGSTPAPQPPDAPQEYAPFSVDFDSLLQMNGECVGWVCVPDTSINYPVMLTTNNSKYLDILPDGTKNSSGSIFMDCRCEPDLSETNTVIYGHHMNNGSMFAPLDKFYSKSFFDEHRTVYYLTPDADYKITVIACMKVQADGEAYDIFGSEAELKSYLTTALQNASVSAKVDVNGIDRIVTLSTCSGRRGVRTIVIGTVRRIGE